MTITSTRNISYREAVAAGLIVELNNKPTIPENTFHNLFETIKPGKVVATTSKTIEQHKLNSNKINVITSEKAFPGNILNPDKEAYRDDANKLNWSLMPFEAIEEINKVLEFGARKYNEWNFTQGGGMRYSRILNSMLRHIFSYMRGQDLDPESGLSHLAHVGCNVIFLLYYNKYPEIFKAKDDRHVR